LGLDRGQLFETHRPEVGGCGSEEGSSLLHQNSAFSTDPRSVSVGTKQAQACCIKTQPHQLPPTRGWCLQRQSRL